MIQNRFRSIVEDLIFCHPDEDEIVLLAVSGGMDSMCMADLFLEEFGRERFAVAHCNFRLRGEDSEGDESFVRHWAMKNDVRFHSVCFDTSEYASERNLSIEMAARELRYRWFGEICKENGYRTVAAAHHADDNAETLMLNLLRGTGIKGMTGMKPVSDLPYSDPSEHIQLIRPLLPFTRKQIEGYMYSKSLEYRTDSTNASVEYRRNSIRHEVFPVMERMNPSFIATLNREIRYLTAASEIVDEWCRNNAPEVSEKLPDGTLSISFSSLLSRSHWPYLLYHLLEPYGFNSSVLESVEELLSSGRTVSGKSFESSTHVLLTERDSLVVHEKKNGIEKDTIIEVHGPGIHYLAEDGFLVELIPWNPDMPLIQPSGTLIFDAAKLHFPFGFRRWRKGDWMIPLGMKGRKKISDLFADLKYGHKEKAEAVVLSSDKEDCGHVAAVLCVRIDNAMKVSEKTAQVIRISKIS